MEAAAAAAEAVPAAPPAAPAAAAAPTAEAPAASRAPLAYADGIDARLLGATACCSWLAHAAVAATTWAKLNAAAHRAPPSSEVSWGTVFAPQWVSHAAQCTLHVLALLHAVRGAALRPATRRRRRASAGARCLWGCDGTTAARHAAPFGRTR